MPILPVWLRRADPAADALILPDRRISYGEALALPPRAGLAPLEGGAADVAPGLIACGLGGGTAFPLPPALDGRDVLLAKAAAAASSRLVLILATSGSTGAPRAVRLPWRAAAAAARLSARAVDLGPGDIWLACLPLHHAGGAMIPYRCWRAGATALIHEGFDAQAVLRDLADRRVTHVSLVPPMLARLLDAGESPPPSLRAALVGGAALSTSLAERAARLGWPVRRSWGMTETCATAALDGWPLPGVRVRVDASGALEVATPARMAGYLGEPDTGEWIVTRDMGEVGADGRVRVAGRADDMLVSAGVNVHPAEVESGLSACPGVREAGVAGVPDPVWGNVIAAVYEGEAGEIAVESWCRDHLSAARRPRRFMRVASLPRLPSGKLDRQALTALVSP